MCCLKIPRCIICHNYLTARYDEILDIDPTKEPIRVLVGYTCEPCRAMDDTDIHLLLMDSMDSMEAAEKAYKYKQWKDNLNRLLEEYTGKDLPEGYSFP